MFLCHFSCTLQLGQALSTRPDILPSAYCQELAKLQVTLVHCLILLNGENELLDIRTSK
jgi:hypothetical protein